MNSNTLNLTTREMLLIVFSLILVLYQFVLVIGVFSRISDSDKYKEDFIFVEPTIYETRDVPKSDRAIGN